MRHDTRTPGQAAYEEDCRRKPRYEHGPVRRAWRQLDLAERGTWERNPTPRDFGPLDTVKPIDDAPTKV
jgi:hypothetical protein